MAIDRRRYGRGEEIGPSRKAGPGVLQSSALQAENLTPLASLLPRPPAGLHGLQMAGFAPRIGRTGVASSG